MTVLAEPPALAPRRVHEVCGAAAAGFAAAQAGLRCGPLLWILAPDGEGRPARERPDAYGLTRFFDPGRLILVEPRRDQEVYWAMEEALRAGAASLVIAETPARGPLSAADLTRSRRLQLAAEAGGATGLLITRLRAAENSNAAETRWRAEPAPCWGQSADMCCDLPSASACASEPPPLWDWRLLKNKRGPLGRWRVRWLGAAARAADNSVNQAPLRHGSAADRLPQSAPHPLALAAPGGGGARAAA